MTGNVREYLESAIIVFSIIMVAYGGFREDIVFLVGGVFLFLLSLVGKIMENKEKIDRLYERLDFLDEINKIKERLIKLEDKMGKRKGQIDPRTAIIIILLILLFFWLRSQGII